MHISFVNGEVRREPAGGEGVEGAETSGEFGGGQAALAVEPAEKIARGTLPFVGVTLEAAGDKVAGRSAAAASERHDVVETPNEWCGPPQTIKAEAALTRVDGPAQSFTLEKIRRLARDGAARRSRAASRANLLGQTHLNQVIDPTALHQAQRAPGEEAAQGIARRPRREPHTAGEPRNGKAQAVAAFEMTMPDKVRVDRALGDGKAKARDEKVFQLFPDECGVGFFGFHVWVQEKLGVDS